jgi:phage tail sheath protein FI
VDGPVASYRLEESLSADFADAVTVYSGSQTFSDLAGRGPGAYYYRVRAEGQSDSGPLGPWSKGQGIQLGATRPWQVRPLESIDEAREEDRLAQFHTALLTLCAARSDLFAVLSLPAFHYEEDALRYTARLQRRLDSRTLSFGALYHPWVYLQQDEESTKSLFIPADGVMCGAIARRTLARGAWLAAANDPLVSVLALEPRIATARLLDLQEGSLNILREGARGFLTLSEQTLSFENEYQPMHVRRLFRRQVQRGLEEVLAGLFQRGAFQGGIPERAYRVDVSDRINPPASLEQGRLIVEIRVAPSQALTFLTIRLMMGGTSGVQVQEAV